MKYLCHIFRYLTLIISLGAPISFLITYGIAVSYDHVSSFWPYISDTGTKPPESCLFGFFLNVFAFLLLVIVYLKYRFVAELIRIKDSIKIKPRCNILSFLCGLLSSLGLILVANFQETEQIIVHIIGALMAFTFGIIYFCFQTNFTRKLDPTAKKLFLVRLVLTILSILFITGFLAPIAPAMIQFKGENILKWTADDGGFKYHIVSTFCEWFLMLSYSFSFATIFWDFKNIKIVPPPIKFNALESNSESNAKRTGNETLQV